jgi:uncharacterized protein with ParB-like and HNH nuclease domain
VFVLIQAASMYQISDILNADKSVKYIIPKYQREYVWGKDNWESLMNDLMENDKGHFLGSIICINQASDALATIPLEVVDGQQRLTTLSILFSAIYERLKKENSTDDDFIATRSNLKYRLIQKSNRNELKLELSYQNSNYYDYVYILSELGLAKVTKKVLNIGNRRIYKAFQFFKKKLESIEFEKVMKFLDKINSSVLVKIEVNNHSDAYVLFESLNNRGIPLSAIDLIKNKFLSTVEKQNVMKVDEAFEEWTGIIENLPDYVTQERFLRHYYNAFRHKYSDMSNGANRATKSNLIKVYEGLINYNVKNIFDELIEKSRIYNTLIQPDEDQNIYFKDLTNLMHIGAAPAYTFLLYLFSEHSEKSELLKKSIALLCKYFVRRSITDYPGTRDLDLIFINLVDICKTNSDSLDFPLIEDYLTSSERFADIKLFEEKLRGNIYEENTDAARYILCALEEDMMTKEIYTNLWERDKAGKYIWTIEHVFPEGENIPSDWINMIARGDEEGAKTLQINYVHRLGNLTLTAYNSNLSNFNFIRKRDRVDKNGKFIGYKNGLNLNKVLSESDSWEIGDIEARTEKLVHQAIKLFSVSRDTAN